MEKLEVNNLHVQFDTRSGIVRAVNGISFSLLPGEVLGLVGETGAGKTTLALALMQLVAKPRGHITEGEIILDGENLLEYPETKMRELRGNRISMIFQDPMTALNPIETVGSQIAEVIRLHTKCPANEAKQRAAEMLEIVDIPAYRSEEYPHQFSGGMKQRVVIAMALACNPEILIADEPTTALDVTIQAQVLNLMKNLQTKYRTATIMITHDLGIVAQICSKVAIVYAGEIVEYGTLADIFDRPLHPYTKALFGAIPSLDKKVARLEAIEGLMPNPIHLPEGCYFHPRCKNCMERCGREHTELTEAAEGHFVRCFLAEEGQ